MKNIDLSMVSAIIGSILVVIAAVFNIGDKIDFAIALMGVYFILAGMVSNKKLKEFLRG